MFTYHPRFFVPEVQPSSEALELHQISYDFHHEVRQREAFEQYCQWYSAIAERHQQELVQMRREPNLFRWFCRGMGR